MDTIILFSRCDLVHLYGQLNRELSDAFKIINIAYSSEEEQILKEIYNIDEIINFKVETNNLFQNEIFNEQLCISIDDEFIKYSKGRFCLNSAIQNDRTFSHLPYKDCLLMAQVYYKFWDKIFSSYKVLCLIHEPTALYFSHVASIICTKYNAQYLSQIQVFGQDTYNWIFVEGDDGYPVEINDHYSNTESLSTERIAEIQKFIQYFRSESTMLVPQLSKVEGDTTSNRFLSFFKQNLLLIGRHIKRSLNFKKSPTYKSLDHVEYYLDHLKPTLTKELQKSWTENYSLVFDNYDPNENYYYYPMHLEPEAVVLYWGDGIYKNQVKLIENIAGQLPVNCCLFVKDHPHGGYYRDIADYNKIKAIPNVSLLHPGISGRDIISNSRGVFTINGTSGFEAILLNKQVFVFGNSFYDLSSQVKKIHNIRDLREELYLVYQKKHKDDADLFKYLDAYLQSTHPGFISYFANRSSNLNIDEKANIEIVANGILEYLNNRIPQ